MSQTPSRYNFSEKLFFAFGVFLLVGAGTVFFSGYSIRGFLFGDHAGQMTAAVGTLGEGVGDIRRQTRASTEFKVVESGHDLFNMDTIVTGAGARARVDLQDGSAIELGENTMVRLAFEDDFTLGGVKRAANVEVVQGQVSGKAAPSSPSGSTAKKANAIKTQLVIKTKDKVFEVSEDKPAAVEVVKVVLVKPERKPLPASFARPSPSPSPQPAPVVKPSPSPIEVVPSPSPSPTPSPVPSPVVELVIRVLSPTANVTQEVPAKATVAEVKNQFEWTVSRPSAEVQLKVQSSAGKTIFEEKLKAKDLKGQVSVVFNRPGVYVWQFTQSDGRELTQPKAEVSGRITVKAEFLGLSSLPALVGGKATSSNAIDDEVKRDFAMTLRWDRFPRTESYSVIVAKNPDLSDPVVKSSVKGETFNFKKDQILAGKVYYKVTGQTENGFRPHTGIQSFNFDFLPPLPVLPKDQAEVKSSVEDGNRIVLITWQKTNFTEEYELQVSHTQTFEKLLQSKKIKENFLVFQVKDVGVHWWRVRSISKGVSSAYSKPYLFTVK